MPQVILSEVLGFCMGVSRAVEMARQASGRLSRGEGENARKGPVYTLGPLIHNPRVLHDLSELDIRALDEKQPPFSLENSTVIIRAHGICPVRERKLGKKAGKILDATCPHVKANQKTAQDYAEKGYRVFLGGEKDHAELIGIRSYAEQGEPGKTCMVVSSPQEAERAAG